MLVLAIDTSCDETAAAVLDEHRVLSTVVWSQIKYHRQWGGVVPSIARRAHEERLPIVIGEALKRAKNPTLDAIAVTIGPGLAPALEAGIAFAKKLALEKKLPLIPVNHLEGHIASLFLRKKSNFPYVPNLPNLTNWLSLIVSGGHTELVATRTCQNYPELPRVDTHSLLGQTLDDAAGECIDKVGRELGLGYPAGAVVERLAHEASRGRPSHARTVLYKFPIPMERSPRNNLNFSFSGVKTAAIQMLHHSYDIQKSSERTSVEISKQEIVDFCASFQEAIIDALLLKLKRATETTNIKTVFLTGGVAANNRLRQRARSVVRSLGGQLYATPKRFSGDNAAMIGLAAQWAVKRGEIAKTKEEIEKIDRKPNLNFTSEVL